MSFEILGWLPGKKTQLERRDQVAMLKSQNLRYKVEELLFRDRFADEMKKMLETNSGCGFSCFVEILRHYDSPVIKTRENQQHFLQWFKDTFGDLDAPISPIDIMKMWQAFPKNVAISAYYYAPTWDYQVVVKALLGEGQNKHFFPIEPFDLQNPEHIKLSDTQLALFGLDSVEGGHYMLSEESPFLERINSGGSSELQKYLDDGYHISEIFVFDREKADK